MKNITTKYHLFESNEDDLYKKLLDAINYNNIETVKEIAPKVDLNKNRNKSYYNIPLLFAVFHNNYDIVKILLENGADINIKNSNGDNSLGFVGDTEILELLLDYNINININRNEYYIYIPLLHHVNEDNYEIVKVLLENDADIKTKDEYNRNALFYVNNNMMIDLLMKYNIECVIDKYNQTFLYYKSKFKDYIKENYPDFYKQCLKIKKLRQFNI